MPRGGKREGAGAPLRAGSLAKNRSIKFTDQEWLHLKQLATANNQTVSDYVREKALGQPKEDE